MRSCVYRRYKSSSGRNSCRSTDESAWKSRNGSTAGILGKDCKIIKQKLCNKLLHYLAVSYRQIIYRISLLVIKSKLEKIYEYGNGNH